MAVQAEPVVHSTVPAPDLKARAGAAVMGAGFAGHTSGWQGGGGGGGHQARPYPGQWKAGVFHSRRVLHGQSLWCVGEGHIACGVAPPPAPRHPFAGPSPPPSAHNCLRHSEVPFGSVKSAADHTTDILRLPSVPRPQTPWGHHPTHGLRRGGSPSERGTGHNITRPAPAHRAKGQTGPGQSVLEMPPRAPLGVHTDDALWAYGHMLGLKCCPEPALAGLHPAASQAPLLQQGSGIPPALALIADATRPSLPSVHRAISHEGRSPPPPPPPKSPPNVMTDPANRGGGVHTHTLMVGGGLHYTMIALKLQEFQYILKKKSIASIKAPRRECQNTRDSQLG